VGGDLGIDQWYVWTLVSGMCGHLPVSCVSLYPRNILHRKWKLGIPLLGDAELFVVKLLEGRVNRAQWGIHLGWEVEVSCGVTLAFCYWVMGIWRLEKGHAHFY
jgi:hypothetical protein